MPSRATVRRRRTSTTVRPTRRALPWLLLLLLPVLTLLATVCAAVNGVRADEDVYRRINEIIGSEKAAAIMDGYVLIVPASPPRQSAEYSWKDFVQAYGTLTGSPENNIDGKQFLHGGSVEAGIVNIAAFLAQCMQETIQYDACDENNWSIGFSGVPDYPLSAACGQAGQDYSQYRCWGREGPNQRIVQCPIDNSMVAQARTWATWDTTPPPLFCAPRTMTGGGTPRWDFDATCQGGQTNQGDVPAFPEPFLTDVLQGTVERPVCNVYQGQQGGMYTLQGCDADLGCPNADRVDTAGGRVHYDVEGCCWWGRGVIQTTGPCNFGKVNYYLTGTYYDENGNPQKETDGSFPYPDLNICADPDLLCNGPPEFKWLSGMFFWLTDIQTYSGAGGYSFNFRQTLETRGSDIFRNPPTGRSFVDSVSGLVNRGCPDVVCPGSGPVHAIEERYQNFLTAMRALQHVTDPEAYGVPPGEPAVPYLGPWYSKPVLCEACKTVPDAYCGLKWWSGGGAVCVNWATTPQQCEESGGAATAWCKEEEDTERPSTSPSDAPSPSPTTVISASPSSNPTLSPTNRPTTQQPTSVPTDRPTKDNGSSVDSRDDDDETCVITVNREECRELMKHHASFIQQEQRRILRASAGPISDGNGNSNRASQDSSDDNDADLCACWNFCGTSAEGCNKSGEKRLVKCAAHALVAGCTMDDATPAPAPTPPLPTCQVQIGTDQCASLMEANPREIDPEIDADCQCRSFCNGAEIMPCCRFDDPACILECDGDLVSGCPVYHGEDSSEEDALDRIWNGACAVEVDLNECARLMESDEAKDLTVEDCECAHFCNGRLSKCCKHGEYCEPDCIGGWFVGGCDVTVFEDR